MSPLSEYDVRLIQTALYSHSRHVRAVALSRSRSGPAWADTRAALRLDAKRMNAIADNLRADA